MRKLFFSSLVLSFFLLLQGCSESTFTEPETGDIPTFQMKTITVPEGMLKSSNHYAQEAMNYLVLANTYGKYASLLVPPEMPLSKKTVDNQGPPWVYTWEIDDEYGTFTATLTITETDPRILTKPSASQIVSDKYYFSLVIDGTIEDVTVSDFVFIVGEQSKDYKNGGIIIYDPKNVPNELGALSWTSSEDGVYVLTIIGYGSYEINITVNEDDSGSIQVYKIISETEKLLEFKAEWNSDGDGEWWVYEDNGTTVEDHGTWDENDIPLPTS